MKRDSPANLLYFAYGSNMSLRQMAHRCPAAKPLGIASRDGFCFAFRSHGGPHGYATLLPQKGSTVAGLLWSITPECERSLDGYEGYPYCYGKTLLTDSEGRVILTYIMRPEISRPCLPAAAYFERIRLAYWRYGLSQNALKKALDEAASSLRLEIPGEIRRKRKPRPADFKWYKGDRE